MGALLPATSTKASVLPLPFIHSIPPVLVRLHVPPKLPVIVRLFVPQASVVAVPPLAVILLTVVAAVTVKVAPFRIYRLSVAAMITFPNPVMPLVLVVQLAEAELLPASVAEAEVV